MVFCFSIWTIFSFALIHIGYDISSGFVSFPHVAGAVVKGRLGAKVKPSLGKLIIFFFSCSKGDSSISAFLSNFVVLRFS
ncbi:hypothetical protein DFH27DRAFT_548915 [Peziza echinospora]|nr:hypothetical protein DFH27DRAFT_548915 [Peziza echinospora]